MGKDNLKLIVMDNCKYLGIEVNEHLKLIRRNSDGFIVKAENPTFSNSEGKAHIQENIEGTDLFILSDIGNHDITYTYYGEKNRKSFNDNFIDTVSMIDACANEPNRIWLVTPLLYASRQHRDVERESLNAKLALKFLQSMGTDGIITFDAHDPTVANDFKNMSFHNIYPTNIILNHFERVDNSGVCDLLILSPDKGAVERTSRFAKVLNANIGIFDKKRDVSKVVNGTCQIQSHSYIGTTPIKDKNVIIIDDMIASGKSIIDVATFSKNNGAKKTSVFATFGLFSNGMESIELFNRAYEENIIDKVYITNLSYISPEIKMLDWVEIVDCSYNIAETISLIHDKVSSEISNSTQKRIPTKKLIRI